MKKEKRKRRWLRWLFFAVLAIVLLPVLEVGCVKFVNPSLTPEMIRFELSPKSGAVKKRGLRYEWMPLADIPREQVRMIWASEDQRFFVHDGIDFEEIQDALDEAKESGEAPRGASTISQQCARSVFLWQGRSWIRKGLEAYYTVLMEALLSKQRILELYLNVIELGNGIYGVKAAAATYYGKSPAELSPAQMAMLAAILPNPKEWDPAAPTPGLRRLQQRVLKLEANANFPADELPAREKR